MKKISIIILFLIGIESYAQNRYMVFFDDKSGTPYSIDQPANFLSSRAVQRRAKQGISIIQEDLPVNPNYVQIIKDLGIETFFQTKWMNGVLVQMDENQAVLVEMLDFVESVEEVAPNAPLSPRGSEKNEIELSIRTPNLAISQQSMLGVDLMHQYGFYGKGMLIAVFDDGFQNFTELEAFSHILNDNRMLYTFDFVTNQESVDNNFNHGTRVFSIIGADQEGYTGVAPQATFILSVTEAPLEYRIEEYNWLFAAEKADSAGVDVINTSLGYHNSFTDPTMNYSNEQLDGQTAVITKAANMAASKGIVLVNSAGNSGSVVSAPADSPYVLSVGAITNTGNITSFSSRGTFTPETIKPDVVALGQGTLLVTAEGNLVGQNGTSFSSPLVAGLVAGVWEAFPSKSASEIREMIRLSGDRSLNPDQIYGHGLPNFARIIENQVAKIGESSISYSVFPNPTYQNVEVNFDQANYGLPLSIQLINHQGQMVQQFDHIPFESRSLNIELSSSGMYFLRVISASSSSTRKIIKY